MPASGVINFYKRIPFVCLAISLAAGVLAAKYIPGIYIPSMIALTALTVIIYSTDDRLFLVGWLSLIMSFGWINHSIDIARIENKSSLADTFHQQEVVYTGTVISIGYTGKGMRIGLKNIFIANEKYSMLQDINSYIYTDSLGGISLTDTISGSGDFYSLQSKRNPGDFDFKSFYQRKNFYGRIFQHDDSQLVVAYNDNLTPVKLIENCRSYVRNVMELKVGGRSSGLLQALLLGDKTGIDPEIKEAFVTTGIVHVLAVSGLHVGYVLLILLSIVRIMRIPWGWDRLAIIGGLIFFVILTGGKPSVVRAAVMAALYILAPVVNRPSNVWNIIALPAFLILVAEPTSIGDLGFLLSFTAVISIIYFYGLFERLLPEKIRVSRIENKFLKNTWGLFLVSLAAQIGTLPLTIYYFGRFPMISLIANLAIVPLIGLLAALGFALLIFSWLPWVGWAIGNTVWFLAEIIVLMAGVFSKVPFASLNVAFPGIVGIVAFLLAIAIFELLAHENLRHYIIIVMLIIANLVTWDLALRKKYLNLVCFDCGQGDAILIRFADGKSLLIDGSYSFGSRDMGAMVVIPTLRHFGINKLNWLVMTHPHNDHIGGLVTVLESIPVDQVWDTKSGYKSFTYNRVGELISTRSIDCRYPLRGDCIRIDTLSAIHILAPDPVLTRGEKNINNLSIVFKLIYGKNKFLFMGDLEKESERFLLLQSDRLDADVLKVAHHGSSTGSSPKFLAEVSPEISLISVGEGNKFDHPAPATLMSLARTGSKIMRTNMENAVWLRADGRRIEVHEWK